MTIKCFNGDKVELAFALDTCDREVISYVAKAGAMTGAEVVALGQKLALDKCLILVATTKDINHIHAGKIVAEAAQAIGGKGGGRADFAQAGGSNSDGLAKALHKVKELITT